MIVSHVINSSQIKKEVRDNPGFLLSNKKGGYFSLGAKKNFSKYNGSFFSPGGFDLIKTIESIHPESVEVIELKNHISFIERINNYSCEKFYMNHSNIVLYEISGFSGNVCLWLDCRKAYDFHDVGRIYSIYKEDDMLIIEYTKFKDESLLDEDYKVFTALSGVDCDSYELVEQWFPFEYEYDNKREESSGPKYIYDALKIKISNNARITFGFSCEKEEAKNLSKKAFENFDHYVRTLNNYNKRKSGDKAIKEDVSFAFICAKESLDMLLNKVDGTQGIFAGFPWFNQFWTRDEAISLCGLIKENKLSEAKDILFRQLSCMQEDGRISNRFPHSELASADGVGWVFKRLFDLIKELGKKKMLSHYMSKQDIIFIKKKLRLSINNLLENHTQDGLAFNDEKETWMDTVYEGDTRKGYRIEIQALRLLMYRFMQHLCVLNSKNEKKRMYEELEEVTLQKVRENFLKDYLYDGLDDPTIRPNVFLAYYIYPELLSKKEWKETFDKTIEAIWLDWGGFATIDKCSHLYFPEYTGENNRSYHRGDSWYFVNNIAAICLSRLDKRYYSGYIEKIIEASAKDILHKGFVGHGSELSSASFQKGEGCLAQAWSVATFIELCEEVKKL